MLLVPIPWAGRVWALPFLTALAPSERYSREHGRRHKKLTDWARQLGSVTGLVDAQVDHSGGEMGEAHPTASSFVAP